jgi:glycyl-tRNA synthetase|tara:strand:- start:1019 stop:2560 length:1542 start_codon:yes stop_codon:yes gene_type:complete
MEERESLKKIVSHSKEYGFVIPSSEIYEGLNAVYDYAHNGVLLKNNIRDYWWKSMVQINQNIIGLDSAIFMHPKTWIASGHVEAFNDPLIDNKDSKKRYRADVLLESYIEKQKHKIDKEVLKARKRYGDKFDENEFINTNQRVLELNTRIKSTNERMVDGLKKNNLKEIENLINELEIKCPVSGTSNWTEVRQFNLMFKTNLGASSDSNMELFLRPETAQGIFLNYLTLQKTSRMKIPFGIAQTGKAFRNEIVARQFIFRMREFEQMEMQFFIKPGTQEKWYKEWKDKRMKWHLSLGFEEKKYRFHDHEKLSHYADAASDIEFNFPFGFKELEGIHSRTDFDLKSHEKLSGKKIQYFDTDKNESYTPYVIETSIGLDRMFLSVLSNSYSNETLEDGSSRVVLKIPKQIAPIKLAVLPLLKKDGFLEIAKELINEFSSEVNLSYDEKDAIGRRYRRQDAIGTPYCITIDHQTLEDNTFTLRDRDSMEQKRINNKDLKNIIEKELTLNSLLNNLK